MPTSLGQQTPSWWEPVWELVVHVLVGSALFAVIFTPAVGLDLVVKWLKTSLGISDVLATLLTWTKYIVAGIDALLYVLFMLRMGWLFVSKLLWGELHHDQQQTIPRSDRSGGLPRDP